MEAISEDCALSRFAEFHGVSSPGWRSWIAGEKWEAARICFEDATVSLVAVTGVATSRCSGVYIQAGQAVYFVPCFADLHGVSSPV